MIKYQIIPYIINFLPTLLVLITLGIMIENNKVSYALCLIPIEIGIVLFSIYVNEKVCKYIKPPKK